MTIEEQLKEEILRQYRSVREFSTAVQLPNSTVDSVLRRGIRNSSMETMFTIFSALNLDVESIKSGTLKHLVPDKLLTMFTDDDRMLLLQSLEPSHDALKLARDFDKLDTWGKNALRALADVELARMEAETKK